MHQYLDVPTAYTDGYSICEHRSRVQLTAARVAHVAVDCSSNLVCDVCLQLRSAPPDGKADVLVDIHAVSYGVVILAPADFGGHCSVIYVLGAEVVLVVPAILLMHRSNSNRAAER